MHFLNLGVKGLKERIHGYEVVELHAKLTVLVICWYN